MQTTDPGGEYYEEALIITITNVNETPIADADGPYVSNVGEPLNLDGSGSFDPDLSPDQIASYAWDLDNDGQFDDATGATPTIAWATIVSLGLSYQADPAIGLPTNTIRLQVTDTFGATHIDSTTLTIYDNRPFAAFMAVANPAACGQAVTFDASSSSHGRPDRSIVMYAWDFDNDGQYDDGTGVTATQAFDAFGTYTVGLRVTDDNDPAKTDIKTRGRGGRRALHDHPRQQSDVGRQRLDDGDYEYTETAATLTLQWNDLASLPINTFLDVELRYHGYGCGGLECYEDVCHCGPTHRADYRMAIRLQRVGIADAGTGACGSPEWNLHGRTAD